MIGQQDVVRLLAQCQPAIEAVPGITTFEIMTVLALLHFAQQRVDWVVLEVGLGGRLDATNVVVPAVSVITPISLEHTALLGDTLDLIAREKAGIIKPGVPVVVAPQHAEALVAIEEVAARQGSRSGAGWPRLDLALACRQRGGPDLCRGWRRTVRGTSSQLAALHTPLLGAYQLANATTAIAACAELARQGVPITADSLRRGLAQVVWPGRLEVLAAPPPSQQTLVLDSAHNDVSARLLRSALARYFPGRPLHLVVGVSNDKDAAGILAELLPGADRALLTRSRHPRAADPVELAPIAARYLPADRIRVVPTVPEALALALAQAEPDAVICLAGSLFIAGEGREAWLALHAGALPLGDWAYEAEPPAPGWQVTQTPSAGPAASPPVLQEVAP